MNAAAHSPFAPKIFTRGTLTYTKKGLFMLFFWLMWNNFCLMLFESVQGFTTILYKDNGASYFVMSFFGSIMSIICLVINPTISTYSDRFRSKYGRRRPFLMLATPPLALITMAIPYMPELGRYLTKYSILVSFWSALGITGPIFCIGFIMVLFSLFNYVIMSLFAYYWWDVVPEEVLGRFNGLSNIVSRGAGFVFMFFLYGLGEKHLKPLCFGLGLFFLVFYLVSTWQVKESEYPPPEPRKDGDGLWASIKTYCADCYTQPRYLWFFAAQIFAGLAALGSNYQFFYQHYDLGLSLDIIGKFGSVTTLLLFLVGYSLGSLADRLKPIRLMAPCTLLWAATQILSYYFVQDKWSFLICYGLVQFVAFAYGIFIGALVPEIYPREKLGQFCSAASILITFMGILLNPPLGWLFDHVHNNRLGYLWPAGCEVLAAFCFFRIYHTWKRLHPDQLLPGETPEPPLELAQEAS